MTRLEEIELELGEPSDFVMAPRFFPLLKEWARLKGIHPATTAPMTGVQLANLYHEKAGKGNVSDAQAVAADMFVKIMESLKEHGTADPAAIRAIARDEVTAGLAHVGFIDALGKMIDASVEAMIPRRLEIVRPDAPPVILDGPMHYMTETVIKVCGLGHAVMLVGPAGCGKTTIGEHVARALNLPFFITSTINETHELTGFIDGQGYYHRTPFRQAFENGGVWIADEIDAWDASALLAANSALANGFANFPDRPTPIVRHDNFRMVATANTFGNGADRVYIGRNELDAASLDRFATINVDYDLNLERMFAGSNETWLQRIWKVRKQVNEKKIRHVVSSRAIMMGAAALSIGLNQKDVEEIYLFKGMSKADREKINA